MTFVNVYPARVAIDGVWHTQARVRSNKGATRLQVWVRDPNQPRGVMCILDDEVATVEQEYNPHAPLRNRKAQYLMADGRVIDIQAVPGCGCGNPLKSLPTMQPESQQVVGV
jgi:hypothetical protein